MHPLHEIKPRVEQHPAQIGAGNKSALDSLMLDWAKSRVLLALLCLATLDVRMTVYAGESHRGIPIVPGPDGAFTYADDFTSPKFLADAFADKALIEQWKPGALANRGPNSGALIYRFHGGRKITRVMASIQGRANAPSLGGGNTLALSLDGLDWTEVCSTSEITPDRNGWSAGKLTVPAAKAEKFTGGGEIWMRILLQNWSGLTTGVSSSVSQFSVRIESAGDLPTLNPRASFEAALAALKAKPNFAEVAIVPHVSERPPLPVYTLAPDGLLELCGAFNTRRLPEEVREYTGSSSYMPVFPIHSGLIDDTLRQALVFYLRTERDGQTIGIDLAYARNKAASSAIELQWDGGQVARQNCRAFFADDAAWGVVITNTGNAGLHEVRMVDATAPLSSGSLTGIKKITISSDDAVAVAPAPSLPASGSLTVESADYLPDPAPFANSPAVESPLKSMITESDDFGALRICLINQGAVPVRLSDEVSLNGLPLASQYVDFLHSAWDARGIVWRRIRPRLVLPGAGAEIYVRFRRRPATPSLEVVIPCANALAISLRIPTAGPAALLDYTAWDARQERLYIYTTKGPSYHNGGLTEVYLDGQKQQNVEWLGAGFEYGTALALVKPETPLRVGEYHVLCVRGSDNLRAAAQVRILEEFFPLSAWGSAEEMLKDRTRLGMNASFVNAVPGREALDNLAAHGWRRNAFAANLAPDTLGHPALYCYYNSDEPDAHDAIEYGTWMSGLGIYARRWQDGATPAIERLGKGIPTMTLADHTTRPLNWYVYGQTADIFATDPYPVTYFSRNHNYVRECYLLAHWASRPRPLIACNEAYGYGGGPGYEHGPSPQEYRQNFVQAIGCGVKGLTLWYHPDFSKLPAMVQAVGDCNRMITPILHELWIGAPAELVIANQKQVWSSAILCGPDTVVVALANDDIPAANKGVPNPVRAVKVDLRALPFTGAAEAFECTPDGLKSIVTAPSDHGLTWTVDELADGRLFRIRFQR